MKLLGVKIFLFFPGIFLFAIHERFVLFFLSTLEIGG